MSTEALFTRRTDSYARFIRFVAYRQGLRRYFLQSPLLAAGQRILDAGCGTGALSLALAEALQRRELMPGEMHAFDLTRTMLDRFREEMAGRPGLNVKTAQANVLGLDGLPSGWTKYDLIVSASMLEYVPKDRLASALAGLRGLLAPGGNFVLFITKNNWLMRPMIGRWWSANLYDAGELSAAFGQAGFDRHVFGVFPPAARHLSAWGHIVEAS